MNISSVTDVNACLGYLCSRLTASPKLISSIFFTLFNQMTSFPYSFFVHCVSLLLDSCQLFNYNILAISLKNTESYPVTLCLANRAHNHMISRRHRLHDCSSLPWMFNSSLQFLKRKLNAHCVWRQSIIPRLCHVFTHSASNVLTNSQILQEETFKR